MIFFFSLLVGYVSSFPIRFPGNWPKFSAIFGQGEHTLRLTTVGEVEKNKLRRSFYRLLDLDNLTLVGSWKMNSGLYSTPNPLFICSSFSRENGHPNSSFAHHQARGPLNPESWNSFMALWTCHPVHPQSLTWNPWQMMVSKARISFFQWLVLRWTMLKLPPDGTAFATF